MALHITNLIPTRITRVPTDGLYFGGLAGLTIFDPKDFIAKDNVSIPLQITSCQVLNTETGTLTDKTEAISTSGELLLSPSDKSLMLTFALLNYRETKKNRYRYMIEGLDTDWNTLWAIVCALTTFLMVTHITH